MLIYIIKKIFIIKDLLLFNKLALNRSKIYNINYVKLNTILVFYKIILNY